MPSQLLRAVEGTIAPANDLRERLASLDDLVVAPEERARAFDAFSTTRSGRERAGHFWRIDLETVVPDAGAIAAGSVQIESRHPRVIACDLSTAARKHPQQLARAFGATSVRATKFGSLATAFAGLGAFVYLESDTAPDDPIEITYTAPPGAAIFPYTVVLAERGARAVIIERVAGEGAVFVCGAAEIVTGERTEITYAAAQRLDDGARAIWTRAAHPGRNAQFSWATADLGADLTVGELSVAIEQPGVQAHVTALFFPRASQHVDVVSTVDHSVGDASSETVVKSAAAERGQARFLGNIRIAAHAQGSDARLRDDALLLSTKAHIDSVPALEIAANDVKAYHGATIGALDDEQIFYMESRGIERNAAERMIALGFFEPAVERFPSQKLREEIRTALAAKLT